MSAPLFHLAFMVDDLKAAERFYTDVLGCSTGRRSDRWIDFNFYGHQIVAQLVDSSYFEQRPAQPVNRVDDHDVPAAHFGLVMPSKELWEELKQRVARSGTAYLLPPHSRFEGTDAEQGTFFLSDPAGNALEIKYMRTPEALFQAALPG